MEGFEDEEGLRFKNKDLLTLRLLSLPRWSSSQSRPFVLMESVGRLYDYTFLSARRAPSYSGADAHAKARYITTFKESSDARYLPSCTYRSYVNEEIIKVPHRFHPSYIKSSVDIPTREPRQKYGRLLRTLHV